MLQPVFELKSIYAELSTKLFQPSKTFKSIKKRQSAYLKILFKHILLAFRELLGLGAKGFFWWQLAIIKVSYITTTTTTLEPNQTQIINIVIKTHYIIIRDRVHLSKIHYIIVKDKLHNIVRDRSLLSKIRYIIVKDKLHNNVINTS